MEREDAPVVLLACPGLEHVRRGFETFARECFQALQERPGLRVELVKGSGRRAPHERRIPTLRADRPAARLVGSALRRPGFVVEHVSFALSLIPLIARRAPDVVYFSEWHVGRVLARAPQLAGRRPALVMCNGSLAPGPYPHLDHVQQLLPGALEAVVARGTPAERQSVLPLGVGIEPALAPRAPGEVAALRRELGLPPERRVVLSVGALNAQKRHDYVIDEVASLPHPRPFLLLVGQPEGDTPRLAARAARRLGAGSHRILTLPSERMPDAYRASDVFVTGSMWESSGRALIEALAHGLPCLTHDYPVMVWMLDGHGRTGDFTRAGALAALLRGLGDADLSADAQRARHASAYERFSWDRLGPRYVDMLRSAALAHRSGSGSR